MGTREAPARLKVGLAAFALLSVGVGVNLVLLQGGGTSGRAAKAAAPIVVAAPVAPGAADAKAARPAATAEAPAALPVAANAAPEAEAGSGGGETPDSIRTVQRELQQRGYDAGTPDGVAGLVTRAAVMAWEHDHRQPVTGVASESLARLIAGGRQPAPRAAKAGEKAPHAEHVVRTVQQSLTNLGYAPGAVTGRMSADTARAVREFEVDQGLAETGRIGGPLVARLGRLAGQGRLSGQGRVAGR